MKTYTFKVVVEPDEDRWHAYCPALEGQGASTWGHTREEALKHIHEVVQLVVESMIEHGEKLPEETTEEVQITVEPRVTVNV
jgi:predicted RNase H-like HicB family nuclease